MSVLHTSRLTHDDTTDSTQLNASAIDHSMTPTKKVNFSNLSDDATFVYNSPINSKKKKGATATTSTPNDKKKADIIRKYLRSSSLSQPNSALPSPVKDGSGTPYERVTHKLDEVLEKYCDRNNHTVEVII